MAERAEEGRSEGSGGDDSRGRKKWEVERRAVSDEGNSEKVNEERGWKGRVEGNGEVMGKRIRSEGRKALEAVE